MRRECLRSSPACVGVYVKDITTWEYGSYVLHVEGSDCYIDTSGSGVPTNGWKKTGATTVDNSATATVDYRAFGDLPLEIWQQNMDPRCKTLGLARADAQWATPNAQGITSDARYWADDMYMITALQVEAYRVTKDMMYLDRTAKTMMSYFSMLQQAGGLFWHTMTSKAYWGRANGWVVVAMCDLLDVLPREHAGFEPVRFRLENLLRSIAECQDGNSGLWHQMIDKTDSYLETSASASLRA